MSKHTEFGFPDEWQAFLDRHPVFTEKLQLLHETFMKVFKRCVQLSNNPADRVVYFLGRLCIEDFMEILLLCGNGYGIGGMKLLRGLYERAVTTLYIAKNPEKADEFLGYYFVHRGKHFNHASKLLSMEKDLTKDLIEEIKVSYDNFKDKYQEDICKKCGTKRPRLSWSELDTLSMARKVGLENLYFRCYYEPTLQTHATVISLQERIIFQDSDQAIFDHNAQRERADNVLILAHNIILCILELENSYFKMLLEDDIQERFKDFKLIWSGKDKPNTD